MGRKPQSHRKDELFLEISQSQKLRPSSIRKRIPGLGKTTMYKYLKILLTEQKVIKSGKFPKIYYQAVLDEE